MWTEPFKTIQKLDTWLTYINSSILETEVQFPFGGTKKTDNGQREAGTTALEILSEWKSVFVDYSGGLQKAQIEDWRIFIRKRTWIPQVGFIPRSLPRVLK